MRRRNRMLSFCHEFLRTVFIWWSCSPSQNSPSKTPLNYKRITLILSLWTIWTVLYIWTSFVIWGQRSRCIDGTIVVKSLFLILKNLIDMKTFNVLVYLYFPACICSNPFFRPNSYLNSQRGCFFQIPLKLNYQGDA